MNVKLKNIADRGLARTERLRLSVLADVDLNYYVMFQTTSDGADVNIPPTSMFWFPTRRVKAGDQVILYSRAGTESVKRRTDGSTIYFYFWGSSSPLWADQTTCAVLIEVNGWETMMATGVLR